MQIGDHAMPPLHGHAPAHGGAAHRLRIASPAAAPAPGPCRDADARLCRIVVEATDHQRVDRLMDQFTRNPFSLSQRDEDMLLSSIAPDEGAAERDPEPTRTVSRARAAYAPAPLGMPADRTSDTPPPPIAPQVDVYPQVTNLGTLIDILV